MTIVYNEIEGRLKVNLTESIIDEIIDYETESPGHGLLKLNQWAVTHWNMVKSVKPGFVIISNSTAEYIIDRLRLVLNEQGQEILKIWTSYGWTVAGELEDWKCVVNFYRINYEETE